MRELDLFDPRCTQDLWEQAAEWRRERPVAPFMPGYWYVSRYEDARAVLRDAKRFPNGNGMMRPDVDLPLEERNLGAMDPPFHPFARRLLRPAFAPATAAAERPFARATAHELLDALAAPGGELDKGPVDLVGAFTERFPARVALHLLGFPLEDLELIMGWVGELMRSTYPSEGRTERGFGLAGAFPEMSAYVDAHIEERRQGRHGTDDLVARMTLAEYEGERLSVPVLRRLVVNMITGSLSTTRNLVGNLFVRLLTDPELHRALRDEPDLVPAAVEECLRLDPPVLFVVRQVAADTELAGTPVPGGDRLIVGLASANRDERAFADPDEYRLDRPADPGHLSFSAGPHVCIGADLARMSASEAVTAFVETFEPGELVTVPGWEWRGVPVFLEYGPVDIRVSRSSAV